MAFKTYYFSLWMFLIFFTLVKGSCLEYGHSCWGAHGKRSGSNKIYHAKDKAPMEFDFQDLNGLSEKNTYDSTEEALNGASDALSAIRDLGDDELAEGPDKNSINLKTFLYKKLNRTNKPQRKLEFPEHYKRQRTSMPALSERWRRLPFYNLKKVQIALPQNDWLKHLEQENEGFYI